MWIWETSKWQRFFWREEIVRIKLGELRRKQGVLFGKLSAMGWELQEESLFASLTAEAQMTAAIEGERLPANEVRSSVARQLGKDIPGMIVSNANIDGLVEMMLDATQNYEQPLSEKRVMQWQAGLFPNGLSNGFKITTRKYRTGKKGAMQVVSGTIGKEKVHFVAPDAKVLAKEMKAFVQWFNTATIDPILKSAIAHLWLVTIHPFEDGNGRIARAAGEMCLTASDKSPMRFYSMSVAIERNRKAYYEVLENTQNLKWAPIDPDKGIDVTKWVDWFLDCFDAALDHSEELLEQVVGKSTFWNKHATTIFNARQQKVIAKMLTGFEGGISSSKYGKLCKCSKDTAVRDIADLLKKKVLAKQAGGGRSTSYRLITPRA